MITKSQVRELLPDNLKDTELFKVTVDAFMEYMAENSKLSLDIANIYSQDNPYIYEEILKIYARAFFEVIGEAKKNQNLQNEIINYHKKFNIDYNLSNLELDLKKFLSFDNLRLLKFFNQSKGNISAMEYIYEIFNKIQFEDSTLQSDSRFEITETGNTMEYRVNSNMIPAVFEAFVKPLVHPVGWKYVFSKITEFAFKEYLFSTESFDVSILQINGPEITDNFKVNRGYLFETDAEGNAILLNGKPKSYKAENTDVLQVTRFGKYYPVLDIDSEINLVSNPGVSKIEEEKELDVSWGGKNEKTEHIKITFKSGEILEQYAPIDPKTGKPSLILYYGKGPNDLNKTIKKDYSPFFSDYKLHVVYNKKLTFTLNDTLTFKQSYGFADTCGSKVVCGSAIAVGSGIKCGQTELPHLTSYNREMSIAPQSLFYSDYPIESLDKTRQVFKGVKYKRPRFFIYLDLTKIDKSDYPLSISLNDNFQVLDYDYHHTKIIAYEGFIINDTRALETGYSEETYNLKIYNSNTELIEEVEFNMIPRVSYVQAKTSKKDFNFELGKAGYSRDARVMDDNDTYPDGWNFKIESYRLDWNHIEYTYYAEIGELFQYAHDKVFIDSYALFNYKPPRYWSNQIGHFIVSPIDFGYDETQQKLFQIGQNAALCYDNFSIEALNG